MSPRRRLLTCAAVCAALFALLAAATMAGAMTGFDAAVRGAAHALAAPGLTWFAATVTWLGAFGVLAAVGAVALIVLLRANRRGDAILLVVAMAGAVVIENALKFGIRRARPDPFFGTDPTTYSFPSGHSLFSLTVYGAIATLAARHARPGGRATIWSATGLLLAAIGFSRVYLGVHYPTDVLGGWLIALAWLAALLSRAPREGRPPAPAASGK